MTTDTAPRYLFAGDWPSNCTGRVDDDLAPRRTGVGPMRIDELCPSCDKPISTTGECKCSI